MVLVGSLLYCNWLLDQQNWAVSLSGRAPHSHCGKSSSTLLQSTLGFTKADQIVEAKFVQFSLGITSESGLSDSFL